MDLEQEEVIHLDYNSQDEYDIPDSNDDDDSDEESEDDGRQGDSEAKLMEYLLKGLVLQSFSCKVCDTPIVKSVVADENPITMTSSSKIEPIGNVPFCVCCNAHYVTSQDELKILWKDEYKAVMGMDGGVLLYMDEELQQQPIFGKMSLVADEDEEGEEEEEEELLNDGVAHLGTNPELDNENLNGVDRPSSGKSAKSAASRPSSAMSAKSAKSAKSAASRPSSATSARLASSRPSSAAKSEASRHSITRSVASKAATSDFSTEELCQYDLLPYEKR